MRLGPARAGHHGDAFDVRAEVSFAPGTLDGASIGLSVEPGDLAVPDPSVLPFVPATYVLACRLGQDLVVDEPLPPAAHLGARAVGGLLASWYGWRPAELIAPLGEDPIGRRSFGWRARSRHRARRGLLFTRGIDSWGTLLTLLDGPPARRPSHLITVDNEVHVRPEVRAAAVEGTRRAAERVGLPLVVVRTDVRALLDPHTDWGTETHGSVFAGVGLLLRRSLDEVIVSPTHWSPNDSPWGSHPDLERRWSVPGMAITHWSGVEPRWKRIRRVFASPLAADDVLVCWQGRSARNCGTCEKCLRLRTSLALLGRTESSAALFDAPFDPADIDRLAAVGPHPWCDTIDHLDRVGLAADELRQRWERVPRVRRPGQWYQDRPVQPRVPVVVMGTDGLAPGEVARARELAARRLAALGVRIDRLHPPRPPALVVSAGPEGARARVDLADGGGPVGERSLGDLGADDLAPLLAALGADPAACVPFDPDGQDPPPVVAPPPGPIGTPR
jgi:hypothetical protein